MRKLVETILSRSGESTILLSRRICNKGPFIHRCELSHCKQSPHRLQIFTRRFQAFSIEALIYCITLGTDAYTTAGPFRQLRVSFIYFQRIDRPRGFSAEEGRGVRGDGDVAVAAEEEERLGGCCSPTPGEASLRGPGTPVAWPFAFL